MISDLVAGHAYWFQCATRTAANLSPISTASRLPFINPQDQTVVVEVTSIPANASFASTTSIMCGAWTFVEGLQQAKNARSARCDECVSAGVYKFSSPAVKPIHGFIISSLTLEFEYLFSSCPQDANVILGIGIDGIVVHCRILVDILIGSACGGHDFNFGFGALNTTRLAVEALIDSAINLHEQHSRSISLKVCSTLHLVRSLHLYLRHADFYFAVRVSTLTFESKPLDGCPSWDLTARRLQATTIMKAQVKIFFRSSVAIGRVVEGPRCCSVSRIFQCLCWNWSEHH